eukprot:5542376-Amphidinium_carterae.1
MQTGLMPFVRDCRPTVYGEVGNSCVFFVSGQRLATHHEVATQFHDGNLRASSGRLGKRAPLQQTDMELCFPWPLKITAERLLP